MNYMGSCAIGENHGESHQYKCHQLKSLDVPPVPALAACSQGDPVTWILHHLISTCRCISILNFQVIIPFHSIYQYFIFDRNGPCQEPRLTGMPYIWGSDE